MREHLGGSTGPNPARVGGATARADTTAMM